MVSVQRLEAVNDLIARDFNESDNGDAFRLLHDQVTWHDALLPNRDCRSRSEVQSQQTSLKSAISQLCYILHEVVQLEDCHVMAYWSASGMHVAPLQAAPNQTLPPTHSKVHFSGSLVLRFEDASASEAVEAWNSWDPLSMQPTPEQQHPVFSSQPTEMQVQEAHQCCKNKDVVRQYFEVYNSGDFGRLASFVHADYSYAGLLDLGDLKGESAMRAMMSGWRDALPDLVISHDFLLAAGTDRVTFRWVVEGTHTGGAMRGVPPTGRRLTCKGVTTLRLLEGYIIDKLSHANGSDLMRQLHS